MRTLLCLAAAAATAVTAADAAPADGVEPAPAIAPVYIAPAPVRPAPAPAAAATPPPPLAPASAARVERAPRVAGERQWTFTGTALLGAKRLSSADWGELDTQAAAGVGFAFGRRDWPIELSANLLISGANEGDTSDIDDLDTDEWDRDDEAWYQEPDSDGRTGSEGTVVELQLGVTRRWALPAHLHAGVGGGLSLMYASLDIDDATTVRHDASGTLGVWTQAQAFWSLGGFAIGPTVGWSWGRVALYDDRDVKVGGVWGGLLLGFHY